MAVDFTSKLAAIASDMTIQARNTLRAAGGLTTDAALLVQTGGDFPDGCFDKTALAYLDPYQANVFLHSIVPALNAFLDSHLENDSGKPTYRQYFEMIVSGPPTNAPPF
jgi:hypothetical protein